MASNTNKLPTTDNERTYQDVQRTQFIKQTYEQEAKHLGIDVVPGKDLTPKMLQLLDTIRNIDARPVPIVPPGTMRTEAQVAASVEIHKRVNPGYVDAPAVSTTSLAFKYTAPPDFSKAYLKKDSDCGFQKYAAEAILKHVDLKKTSH